MRKKGNNESANVKTSKKRKKHPLRTFFSLVAIFIASGLIYMAADDFITTVKLRSEIASNEQMITDLEDQKENLTQEVTNLSDPDYVKRYARGKYMVSKPGEQVFKLPSKSDDGDE